MKHFWKLEHPAANLAVIDVHSGEQKTYGEVRADVQRFRVEIGEAGEKSLMMLLAQNRYECLVAYLTALDAGHPLILVDATLHRDLFMKLVNTYSPDYILGTGPELAPSGYRHRQAGKLRIWEAEERQASNIHEALALLLNTSGSTGSPKLVRLSGDNLQANAVSIASYLNLTKEERPITSLPMAYAYGLPDIRDHLPSCGT